MLPKLMQNKQILANLLFKEVIHIIYEDIEAPYFESNKSLLHIPLQEREDLTEEEVKFLLELACGTFLTMRCHHKHGVTYNLDDPKQVECMDRIDSLRKNNISNRLWEQDMWRAAGVLSWFESPKN